ncbi:RNA 2',3'-cyclic phosphodiesterase [Alkalitalea saponilacus]|uniref:RNA 2',3'-cyclic phosphodiesterase n=1 Tax=Alkalitalea saponilacus TaxID=889453 RepID=A0A1T5EQ57_9BACT|nr:RNA 2',3'-cyclic phosphodiesterase [Alkalitalea saponilacus]ASB48062.1 RNA 2',3'-cyclic phosphodiesterase [Alkalitalea saponilacus]SKB85998.1 2'-5' RNA ligase [Alkalitalea saponilacus]
MKRTFIAVPIQPVEPLLDEIEFFKENLCGVNVKWVDVNQMHITIAFIGETSSKLEQQITDLLFQFTGQFSTSIIDLSGFGVFSSLRSPRVLWLGIKDNSVLNDLHQYFSSQLQNAGIKVEQRDFVAHITIGRIKQLIDEKKFRDSFDGKFTLANHAVSLSKVVYYESVLRPEGAKYVELASVCIC